jgi:uncharacterized protein
VNKILVVILVTILVVYLMRRMADSRNQPKVKPPDGDRKKTVEDMVRCQVCGVNLPRSEAILSRGRIYCCNEHRNADV